MGLAFHRARHEKARREEGLVAPAPAPLKKLRDEVAEEEVLEAEAEAAAVLPVPGYRLEKEGGGWWKLYGPDGAQIGKSTQDEALARESLDACRRGEAPVGLAVSTGGGKAKGSR